jgi:bifunctional non-homologous end joining protein LigD
MMWTAPITFTSTSIRWTALRSVLYVKPRWPCETPSKRFVSRVTQNTTGSRGIHVYVPIVRGPSQKQVWSFAKALSIELARRHPKLITAEYRVAKRPRGHVLVDYNQNAWNRTLASVYSVRPKPEATVSAPITWEEMEQGVELGDFTMMSLPARLAKVGDLWKPLLEKSGRTDLSKFA